MSQKDPSACGGSIPLHLSLPLSSSPPWECEGWNDTQWLTVAQGPGFWPWLAGSVWQLVSPLPSLWPAASTVVVVGLIGVSLWSLTLGLALDCSLLPTWLVARKWDGEQGCNHELAERLELSSKMSASSMGKKIYVITKGKWDLMTLV